MPVFVSVPYVKNNRPCSRELKIRRAAERFDELLKRCLEICWNTVHTNPSQKRRFSKMFFNPEEFENAGYTFWKRSVGGAWITVRPREAKSALLCKTYVNLQFGILIPAGIPLLPNPSTSSEVKSGRKNLSFSYAGGQGSSGNRVSALPTNELNLALISLLTTDTNPANKTGVNTK